ncbi:MAG: ABC-F family ATP-binding cassette domain-containing protein [Acidimicrobiales bacterium]
MSSHLASLIVRGLSVSAGPRPLLDDIDLVVAPGDRLGLVGPNGSGKSTLLQTLAGLRPPEDGRVRLAPRSATVGYLPQEARPQPGETVRALLARRTGVAGAGTRLDDAAGALARGEPGADEGYAAALDRWLALGGADIDARVGAVTADLGLPDGLLDRATAHLSDGQAARVQLVALLLARFDVFLLDEPTNDLDLDGLDRLERFVLGLTAPLVVVSHDRAFLERTVTAVAEIDDHAHTVTRYDGGWTAYLDERARARHHAERDYRAYVDQRDVLVERARTQRRWAAKGARTARRSGEPDKLIRHRNVQSSESMAAHARRTEKALARLAAVDKPWEGWDLRLTIADAGRSGDMVARLDGAVVELGSQDGPDRFVLGPVTLEIGWGDRVAIVGANGSGKTTLLRALLGRVPLAAGHRRLGPGVVVGEIGQGRDDFDRHATLLNGFMAHTGGATAGDARSVLAKFGLGAEHVLRPPASLSPGERTRATLAVLQSRGVNLLILDEPTNHLDLPAIEQLELALRGYAGTLILVTHDRRLLDTVAIDRVVDVVDGMVSERR